MLAAGAARVERVANGPQRAEVQVGVPLAGAAQGGGEPQLVGSVADATAAVVMAGETDRAAPSLAALRARVGRRRTGRRGRGPHRRSWRCSRRPPRCTPPPLGGPPPRSRAPSGRERRRFRPRPGRARRRAASQGPCSRAGSKTAHTRACVGPHVARDHDDRRHITANVRSPRLDHVGVRRLRVDAGDVERPRLAAPASVGDAEESNAGPASATSRRSAGSAASATSATSATSIALPSRAWHRQASKVPAGRHVWTPRAVPPRHEQLATSPARQGARPLGAAEVHDALNPPSIAHAMTKTLARPLVRVQCIRPR